MLGEIAVFVVLWLAHCIIRHGGHFDDTYDCDASWDRPHGNYEIHKVAFLLWLCGGAFMLYSLWKGFVAMPSPNYDAVVKPIQNAHAKLTTKKVHVAAKGKHATKQASKHTTTQHSAKANHS